MANKGEWSEIYAFFKLLADGRLTSADGHLNLLHEYTPILGIFRNDDPRRNIYRVLAPSKTILAAGDNLNIELPQSVFAERAADLLGLIKAADMSDENFASIYEFMNMLKCGGITAKSSDKADIRIIIHRLADGTTPELGYSIKSKLGGRSTLINSNKDNSNFIYRIDGLDSGAVRKVNGIDRFRDKFEYMESLGCKVEYVGIARPTLEKNLIMLDCGMPRIIGLALLDCYSGKSRTLAEAASRLTATDPLHLMHGTTQPMYAYKIKQFLLAFALGMTVSSPWTGHFDANGGYIVVKEDGDLACYHFFDRNELEDYLFYNTLFDTPSRSRHLFGDVYEEDGRYYIKLALQIRFD